MPKKGQNWNKAITADMKKFERENPGKNAIYKGKITGQFEYWLWEQDKKSTYEGFTPGERRDYSDWIKLLDVFNIKGGRTALDKLAYESDQGRDWEEMRMGYSMPSHLINPGGANKIYRKSFIDAIKSMSPKARKMTNAAIIKQLKKL